ncbi:MULTISPECIES: peptidase inhibitor family I36 protein [Streptomyces]|uniref:peptidase inhibitor family I36 protein n=1 Tax=Streptomyces TaxID=1883 RepID=UPI00131B81BA|nr:MULTISPECIES: peptidase inhibitor family I36 protein [Streptomyces]
MAVAVSGLLVSAPTASAAGNVGPCYANNFCVYYHTSFTGPQKIAGNMNIPDLKKVRYDNSSTTMNDNISSVINAQPGYNANGNGSIGLYEHINLGGGSVWIAPGKSMANLGDRNFNDKASSIWGIGP